MNIELWMFGLFVTMAVGFFFVFVGVSLVEKHPIKELIPGAPVATSSSSPYYLAVTESAVRLGFKPAGQFIPNRSAKTYRFQVAFLVSAEHETLLKVTTGKVAGLPLKRTALTSYLAGGRTLETPDEPSASDESGLTRYEFLLNAGLDELWEFHRNQLALLPEMRRDFTEANALEAYETIQTTRVSQLIKLGSAKFIGPDRTAWRYTLKGALQGYFKGFLGQLRKSNAQRHRRKLKRPGDK